MISTTLRNILIYNTVAFSMLMWPGCSAQQNADEPQVVIVEEEPLFHNEEILVGAELMHMYLPQIEHARVALVVNPTSVIGNTHLADSLLSLGIDVTRIFAPEHGFRGTADAGETVKDGMDIKTGLPIISLYGKNKKPRPDQLEGLDYIIFDIQDVGARFYTYISTMHYVMEAAAEAGLPVIVLDRPNPNGHYIAGPVLHPDHSSFVGMHEVPIVHGMTVGEYALMLNGEGWLKDGIKCALTVVACEGYDHSKFYRLPVKPSPNLPNMASIYLYPALCLFEGTVVSVGRGTDKQFQLLGSPDLDAGSSAYRFTPEPKPGAKYPKHEGIECRGYDFSGEDIRELRTYNKAPAIYQTIFAQYTGEDDFFIPFFDKLAGGTALREAISANSTAAEIESVYSEGLEEFNDIRKNYLLYPDFDE